MTHSFLSRTPRLLAVAAAGASVALLAGCSGGGSGGGTDASVTPADSFTMVAPSSGAGQTPAELIAADYKAATGVTIDVTPLPADQYDSTVKTQLQGGTGADLISVTGGNLFPTSVGPLVDAGLIVPLKGDASAPLLTPQTKQLFESSDGTVYAQPTGTVVYGLITNDMTVQATGSAFPASIDDVIASCKKTAGAPAFLGVAGSTSASTAVVAAELAANDVYAQTPDWNQQRSDGTVTFADSKGWQLVFQQITDMVNAGCFPAGAAGAGFPDLVSGVLQGGVEAVALPSLLVAELARQAPAGVTLPISVQAMPAAKGSDPLLIAQPGAGLAINATSDASHQAAVQAFLDWLAQPENNAKFAGYEGSIPAASLGDASQIPTVYASVAKQLASGSYTYLPSSDWTNPAVSAAMGDGLTAILTGQGDAASALAAMDAAWNG